MTDHLAEIKRALWKSRTAKTEFWREYYIRHAAWLQKEYDRLQEKKK
jgi:hypothetical protein